MAKDIQLWSQVSTFLPHSFTLEDGKLYTFGGGNWGVLGHGNESDVRFD